jgi:rhodanese-related sulfurtransferase
MEGAEPATPPPKGSEATDDSPREDRARTISPEEARELLAGNEASAIDIRGDEEWRSGRIPAARHRAEEEIDEALEQIDEEQTVIVVCEDGGRSARLADEISGRGREAVSIEGGMEAWRSEDMPMQPSYDPEEDSKI